MEYEHLLTNISEATRLDNKFSDEHDTKLSRRIIQILTKKACSNIFLINDAFQTRYNEIEKLAVRIEAKQVPDELVGKKILYADAAILATEPNFEVLIEQIVTHVLDKNHILYLENAVHLYGPETIKPFNLSVPRCHTNYIFGGNRAELDLLHKLCVTLSRRMIPILLDTYKD